MYGKLAITCFKYQVYLYGSEAITYVFECFPLGGNRANTMSHQTLILKKPVGLIMSAAFLLAKTYH
jgi:hypothetical protein